MGAIQNKVAGPVSDELALVQAAKGGDVSAFEELVKRYDRNVFRIAQHITQNREDAEDVVQDAFLKAYGNLEQFQGQSKFYTWLVRIAVNEELAELEALDNGKSKVVASVADVPLAADLFHYMAGWASKVEGNTIPISVPYAPASAIWLIPCANRWA